MNKSKKNLIEIIKKYVKEEYDNIMDEPYYWINEGNLEQLADAIINSKLFCNSPDAMDEQEPHVYKWTAVEDDGYTHSESGVANNMFDAFIKATEHSPSYHKKVVIEKIPDDELTEREKELKEWYKL